MRRYLWLHVCASMFQDYRGCQQNPNQAKYQQREQSHQEYRHSCTSLLHGFSLPMLCDAVTPVTY